MQVLENQNRDKISLLAKHTLVIDPDTTKYRNKITVTEYCLLFFSYLVISLTE